MDIVLRELSLAFSSPALPWVVLASYALGAIPFGYLIALGKSGTDIREEGSGNIGATNVARVVGKRLGLLTLFLDALKGAVAVMMVRLFASVDTDGLATLEAIAVFAALLGHCFPIWLRFRGGKGVATAAGALLVHNPPLAGAAILVFAIMFATSRVVSLSSIGASITLPIVYFALGGGLPDGRGGPYLLVLLIILAKHRGNMRRLLARKELSL